jgi:hypothetical protein
MDYETSAKFIFFSIVIYLLYLLVFSILHGIDGVIIWTFIAFVIAIMFYFLKD